MTIVTTHDAAGAVDFHDGIADSWSAAYRKRSFRERLRAFAVIMDREVREGDRWLDIGCGSGVLTAHLARRGAGVVGIDASAAMIHEAQRGLMRATVPVTLRCGDARRMRWSEPDAFDGVLCSSVVEYFDDPSPSRSGAANCRRGSAHVDCRSGRRSDSIPSSRPGFTGWQTLP